MASISLPGMKLAVINTTTHYHENSNIALFFDPDLLVLQQSDNGARMVRFRSQ